MARPDSNTIIKFADDTTVVGLITDNNETAYREEVRDQGNNLSLNMIKTKEMIVDYRKKRTEHAPILIDRAAVEQVESFKFLGVHITNKLTWSMHTMTVVKRALLNLFPLRRLKRFGMGPEILKRFYSCSTESMVGCWLHHWLVWQLLCLRPQGTTEGSVYGPVHHWAKLPTIQDLYTRQCQRKVLKLSKTVATLVIDCPLYYHTASCTGVPSLGPRGF
jgi:hypothetical protein